MPKAPAPKKKPTRQKQKDSKKAAKSQPKPKKSTRKTTKKVSKSQPKRKTVRKHKQTLPATPEQLREKADTEILAMFKSDLLRGVGVARLMALYYKVNPPSFTNLTPIKRAFMEVMKNNLSNISRTCDHMGISRQTYYDWMKNDTAFVQAAIDTKEAQKDWVENKLLMNIMAGKETSAIFYLKTQAKDRGYQETLGLDAGAESHKQALEELAALGMEKLREIAERERNVVDITEVQE